MCCRLQMDEELRREREREREREADREREKEREREREKEREQEKEREREKERELERQREQRAREKELLAAKALEPAFLPVAELHGLRGHTTEERGKPSEQLTPTRAGAWAWVGYAGQGLSHLWGGALNHSTCRLPWYKCCPTAFTLRGMADVEQGAEACWHAI